MTYVDEVVGVLVPKLSWAKYFNIELDVITTPVNGLCPLGLEVVGSEPSSV